jgi:hypothetical protein
MGRALWCDVKDDGHVLDERKAIHRHQQHRCHVFLHEASGFCFHLGAEPYREGGDVRDIRSVLRRFRAESSGPRQRQPGQPPTESSRELARRRHPQGPILGRLLPLKRTALLKAGVA